MPTEKEAARQRMVQAHASSAKLAELARGETRDRLASYVGVSGWTLEKTDLTHGKNKGNYFINAILPAINNRT